MSCFFSIAPTGELTRACAQLSPSKHTGEDRLACYAELAAHTDAVNAIIVCPDTGFLSCSSDKLVLLWRVRCWCA